MIALLIGIALLALSGQRLFAAIALLPGDASKAAYAELADPSQVAADVLVNAWRASRIEALRFAASARYESDLGHATMALAAQHDGAERDELLADARLALVRALHLAPGHASAWLRLAIIERELGAPAEAVLEKVRYAIEVAPYLPPDLRLRVEAILRLWRSADPEMRALAAEQIANLTVAKRGAELEALARRFPGFADFMRDAVGDNKAALRNIDRALGIQSPGSGGSG